MAMQDEYPARIVALNEENAKLLKLVSKYEGNSNILALNKHIGELKEQNRSLIVERDNGRKSLVVVNKRIESGNRELITARKDLKLCREAVNSVDDRVIALSVVVDRKNEIISDLKAQVKMYETVISVIEKLSGKGDL